MNKLRFQTIKSTAIAITMLILPSCIINAITRDVNTLAEINEAINLSQQTGDVIRLTGNIENSTNTAIAIKGKEITLDLNGKTLSGTSTSTLSVTGTGAQLTITDTGKGTITNTSAQPAIMLEDTGSLIFTQGTIDAVNTAISNKYGGDITISGGNITADICIYNNSNGNIAITGGTLETPHIQGNVIYDYNMMSTSGKISISGNACLRSNSSSNETVAILCNENHIGEVLTITGGSIINNAVSGCAIGVKGGGKAKLSGDAEMGLVNIPQLYIAGNLKALTILLYGSHDKRFFIFGKVTGDVTIDGVNLTAEDIENGKIAAIATDPSYIDESKFKLAYLPNKKVIKSGSYLVFADGSGIESSQAPKTTVFAGSNSIVVRPTVTGETVTGYDINGSEQYSGMCTDNELIIPVPEKGVYFVKTPSGTTKVIVK